MIYRSCILFLAAVVAAAAASSCCAADIYVTQVPAGNGSGSDCSDARAVGGLTPADWVAGNTIHLCGTITFPAGSAGLVAQGSGTSSRPIIVKFETNAILEAPYFGGGPSCDSLGSCKSGIEIYGYNYIIVDGGSNGIIENTANGTDLADQQQSVGLTLYNASDVIVRNLTIQNIYLNDPTHDDTAGGNTTDVLIAGTSSNNTICNNALNNARAGLQSGGAGTAGPVYPLPSCSSNTFLAGQNYFGNTLTDHAWTFQVGGATANTINIFNNTLTFGLNWVDANDDFHNDGIIAYGSPVTVYVYNNSFQGNFAGTANVYCTYGGGSSTGSQCYLFNNVFVSGSSETSEIAALLNVAVGQATGPHYVYNNTFVNYGVGIDGVGGNVAITSYNNLFTEGNTSYFYAQYAAGITNQFWVASDYNSFYGGRGLSFAGAGNYYGWPTGSWGSYKSWTSTRFDTHSVSANPQLDASYHLGISSPDVRAGANLTSLCSTPGLGPLCYDKNGVARPQTGPWDIGAFQGPSPNPPSGLTGSVR